MSMALCLVHCDIYVRRFFRRKKVERCYGIIARDANELLDTAQHYVRREFPGYESFDIVSLDAPNSIIEEMFYA